MATHHRQNAAGRRKVQVNFNSSIIGECMAAATLWSSSRKRDARALDAPRNAPATGSELRPEPANRASLAPSLASSANGRVTTCLFILNYHRSAHCARVAFTIELVDELKPVVRAARGAVTVALRPCIRARSNCWETVVSRWFCHIATEHCSVPLVRC